MRQGFKWWAVQPSSARSTTPGNSSISRMDTTQGACSSSSRSKWKIPLVSEWGPMCFSFSVQRWWSIYKYEHKAQVAKLTWVPLLSLSMSLAVTRRVLVCSLRGPSWSGTGLISGLYLMQEQGQAEKEILWEEISKHAFQKVCPKLPWWPSDKESANQCWRYGFNPWCEKLPHVAEQLGLCATTTEPMCYNSWSPHILEPMPFNKKGHCNEKPMHPKGTVAPACHNYRKAQAAMKPKIK